MSFLTSLFGSKKKPLPPVKSVNPALDEHYELCKKRLDNFIYNEWRNIHRIQITQTTVWIDLLIGTNPFGFPLKDKETTTQHFLFICELLNEKFKKEIK